MSPLPYRYAEKSVLRYISILELIQGKRLCERMVFDPTPIGVNSETAACRLRDAIHSLCSGMTAHPSIDPTLLAERFRHYRVSHDGTKVFVIPKTEKRQTTSAQVEVSQASPNDVLARVEDTDIKAISAFAYLLGRHLLQGRVEIVGYPSPGFLESLTKSNDIVIEETSPNLHIMF